MKTLLGALAAIAVIFAIHAIPELAVMILPTWLLLIFAIGFIFGLAVLALWAFVEAWKADK